MIGLDPLAFAHPNFPYRKFIQLMPIGWALGVFDDPFGPVLGRLRWALLHADIPAIRIHAHWANDHSIVPLKKLKDKLPGYEQLAREFRATKFYVSHSCEYKCTDRSAVQERVNLIKQLAPSCVPVNACWQGATIPGIISERHGKNNKAQPGEFTSTDGDNIYDIDAEGWVNANSKAAITFLWGYRFNLREINDPGQAVPPPKLRTAAPSPAYIKSIIRLGLPKGEPPQVAGAKPLPKGYIYKTHAEDEQGTEAPRENRPVLIIPYHGSNVELVTSNGLSVGKLVRFGSDFNGMARYYSGFPGGCGLYGAEIGEKAKKLSGSEWVCVKYNGKLFGPIHPAFRSGSFR